MRLLSFSALLLLGVADAGSSTGCGKDLESGYTAGSSTIITRSIGGETRRHELTIPSSYDRDTPVPLLLYFHGWGGDFNECGTTCEDAAAAGFATLSMTGYSSNSYNSWNGFGSTESPGPDGGICTSRATDYCYADCGGCDDNCWWTTCKDSVEQVEDVWDMVEDLLCIELDSVWASGCSNGGMFTFEVASDARTASRLAGIVPVVGLPHNGFNQGPLVPMHIMGMWGTRDNTVPPLSNTDDPTKSLASGGWYYTTARSATDKWGDANGCGDRSSTRDWNIGNYRQIRSSCTAFTDCESGADVVECLFSGGHVCNQAYQNGPTIDFMLSHSRLNTGPSPTASPVVPVVAPTSSPIAPAPNPTRSPVAVQVCSPCEKGQRGDVCAVNNDCCSNKCNKKKKCTRYVEPCN